ncbi:MAG: AlpA family phage regulatory protein [Oceanospirillaceae bacterium]|nr:AlpA family phage regulatory protein [Oceanospirillaceae bacterium]
MNRIIRRPEVEHLTGIGRSAIYRGMQDGSFPKNISLGGKAVGWKESDIQGWITKQIEAAGMEA